MKRVLPRIQQLAKYTPPLSGRRSYDGVLCDFNERLTPVSPHVRKAIQTAGQFGAMRMYPEYDDLDEKIAAYVGVPASSIMATNGSDQAIDIVFRAFCSVDDAVVVPTPSFAMFYQAAGVCGCRVLAPTYTSRLEFPYSEVVSLIRTQSPALVVICSPNNPTGTLVQPDYIEDLVRQFPNTAFLIDEAYYEFSKSTVAHLVGQYPNLVVTRTFSKAFGLAALRIGYIVAHPDVIPHLLKVRGPYAVNMVASIAARAALDDIEYVESYATEIMTLSKPMMLDFFHRSRIEVFDSEANFLLFRPDKATDKFEYLRKAGFLLRPRSGPMIDGTLRLTLGPVLTMTRFIKAFQQLQ